MVVSMVGMSHRENDLRETGMGSEEPSLAIRKLGSDLFRQICMNAMNSGYATEPL